MSKIIGLQETLQKLNNIAEYSAIETTLLKSGLDLEGKSENLAPVDKGDLRRSGYSSKTVQRDGDRLFVEVGFGAEYALKQHETAEFTHPHGGQWKYLEQPLAEMEGVYNQDMAEAMKETFDV